MPTSRLPQRPWPMDFLCLAANPVSHKPDDHTDPSVARGLRAFVPLDWMTARKPSSPEVTAKAPQITPGLAEPLRGRARGLTRRSAVDADVGALPIWLLPLLLGCMGCEATTLTAHFYQLGSGCCRVENGGHGR